MITLVLFNNDSLLSHLFLFTGSEQNHKLIRSCHGLVVNVDNMSDEQEDFICALSDAAYAVNNPDSEYASPNQYCENVLKAGEAHHLDFAGDPVYIVSFGFA